MAWQLDRAHSEVGFAIKHMMVSTVRGRFKQFNGTIELDEQHPEASRVDVTIDVGSIDTGDEKRDGHLRSADFFDVEHYPTATFTSTRIERLGEDRARIFGDLTLHGVTREIVLEATLEGQSRDMQGQRRAGFALVGSFNRKDFELNWNVALETGGWLVSETVKLAIDAEVLEPATVAAQA